MRLSVLFCCIALSGCAAVPAPQVVSPPSPDLMRPPCQMLPPVSDADEDLAIDVANLECTRQLRLQIYRLQGWARIVADVAP